MNRTNPATQFTVDYIDAVQRRLKIEIDDHGVPIFVPERIDKSNIHKLRDDLTNIWHYEEDSRTSVKNREGAHIQSVAYGLSDDFDTLLKSGYLIGDRVVLLDLLYGRLLRKKNIEEIDFEQLGVVANNLVSTKSLALDGHLVIIRHPFEWHNESRQAFAEIASSVGPNPTLLGLASALAMAVELNLHPYSIIEHKSEYDRLLASQGKYIKSVEEMDAQYQYETLLTATLSARLLNDIRFDEALRKPLHVFHQIVADRKEFYKAFRDQLSSGGRLQSEQNLELLANILEKTILSRNETVAASLKSFETFGASIGGILAILGSEGNPLGIASAAIGFSITLKNLLMSKKPEQNIITAVFRKLLN